MKTIHKYALDLKTQQDVSMPKGAKILTAQLQHGFICLWAMVDDAKTPEAQTIFIVGTGHEVPDHIEAVYVATVQANEFVWHVFKRRKLGEL